MLLETEITIADYRAFLNIVKKTNLKTSPVLYLIYGLCSVAFIAFYIVFDINMHLPTVFIVAAFIVLLASAQLFVNRRKLQPDSDGLMLGKITLTIDADGIRATKEHYESFAKWAGVRSVQETNTHYFVMLDKIGAHIIPKRSFSDEEQMREFKRLIEGNVGRVA